MTDNFEEHESERLNPLDELEEYLKTQNWSFVRTRPNEIFSEKGSVQDGYNISFRWNEQHSTLEYSCCVDIEISEENFPSLPEILVHVNKYLWIGHFDIDLEYRKPVFKHNALVQEIISNAEYSKTIIRNSLILCKRFAPLFQLMSMEEHLDEEELALAFIGYAGRS